MFPARLVPVLFERAISRALHTKTANGMKKYVRKWARESVCWLLYILNTRKTCISM